VAFNPQPHAAKKRKNNPAFRAAFQLLAAWAIYLRKTTNQGQPCQRHTPSGTSAANSAITAAGWDLHAQIREEVIRQDQLATTLIETALMGA